MRAQQPCPAVLPGQRPCQLRAALDPPSTPRSAPSASRSGASAQWRRRRVLLLSRPCAGQPAGPAPPPARRRPSAPCWPGCCPRRAPAPASTRGLLPTCWPHRPWRGGQAAAARLPTRSERSLLLVLLSLFPAGPPPGPSSWQGFLVLCGLAVVGRRAGRLLGDAFTGEEMPGQKGMERVCRRQVGSGKQFTGRTEAQSSEKTNGRIAQAVAPIGTWRCAELSARAAHCAASSSLYSASAGWPSQSGSPAATRSMYFCSVKKRENRGKTGGGKQLPQVVGCSRGWQAARALAGPAHP